MPKSVSEEVRVLQSIAKTDVRSVKGKRGLKLGHELSMDPFRSNAVNFNEAYTCCSLHEQDEWRIQLLDNIFCGKE